MRLTVMQTRNGAGAPALRKAAFAASACMQRLRIQLLEKQKVPPEEMRTVRRKQKREIESGIGFPAPPPAEPPSLNGAPPNLAPNGLAWNSALTYRERIPLPDDPRQSERRRIPIPVPFLCYGHNIHGNQKKRHLNISEKSNGP